MNPDANLRCLHLILKQDKKALTECVGRGFDPADFQKFCDKHLLSGYVYSALSAAQALSLLPKELTDRLKIFYMNQWAVNERLLTEMEKLAETFSLAGIELIFLKGPFLAKRFYDSIACRVTRDIDILVRHNDIDRADKTLLQDGFYRRSKLFLGRKTTIRFTHHFEYSKPGAKAELHWVLARHFSFRIDYEKLWAENEIFETKTRVYRVLSDEKELVMQFLSIFTDIPLGTFVFKQFVDVYHIVKKLDYDGMEWESFFENRKKEGLFLISVNILDLVLSVLECAEDFPALAAALDHYSGVIRCKNEDSKRKLLAPAKFSFRARLWAFGLCEASFLKSFGWWLLSLPFRLSAYPGWIKNIFPMLKPKVKTV